MRKPSEVYTTLERHSFANGHECPDRMSKLYTFLPLGRKRAIAGTLANALILTFAGENFIVLSDEVIDFVFTRTL